MVPRNGKLDGKFWLSVMGLLVAIIGTWVSLSSTVAENGANIERNRDEIRFLRADMARMGTVQHEILMELRK